VDAEARRRPEDLVQTSSEDSALLEPVPFGFCHCRCGGRTSIAKQNIRRLGHINGQPVRFLPGHHAWFQPRGPRQTLAEQFWSQVDRTTTPDGCWPFTGALTADGYGHIKVNGRMRMAHHIALKLSGFIIPFERLQVRHYVCDNPPCCRPSHLKIGTPQDDADDKVSKGRQARGESHGHAKLRQQDADEIRRLYRAGGISQRTLARQFGVNQRAVWAILSGEAWSQ